MSAWENYNGPFNFDATPIGPMYCPVIIHNKSSTRRSWDFRSREGFNIGPALNHYRCFHVANSFTKALLFSDTVDFMQYYLTQPTFSESDCIVRALNFLSCTVKDAPATIYHKQLTSITKLRKLFNNWDP